MCKCVASCVHHVKKPEVIKPRIQEVFVLLNLWSTK